MVAQLVQNWAKLSAGYTTNTHQVDQYWQEIHAAYTQKSRHYHNLSHIASLLKQAETYKEHLEDFDRICFAIWYHDIIYKVHRKDNEQRSADLMAKRLESWNIATERIEHCHAMIVATQKHEPGDDADTNWLLDFDLSILGAAPAAYLAYTQQIRKEYRVFPNAIYKPGRRKVIQYFLNLKRIYKTALYQQLYEEQARSNLKNELDNL